MKKNFTSHYQSTHYLNCSVHELFTMSKELDQRHDAQDSHGAHDQNGVHHHNENGHHHNDHHEHHVHDRNHDDILDDEDDGAAAAAAAAVAAVNAAVNGVDDYSSNIDEQLLRVKPDDKDDKDKQQRDKLPQSHQHQHLQQLQHQQQIHHLQQHQQHQQQQQHHMLQQHQLHPNKYDLYDESEYNIQIPEPIIDSKLKIYPVTENTITAEGNLITRPYPEQVFHSRDDLNEFIQEFARDNGFGVVIAHSNKKAIYYTCELGGRYRHKKTKQDEKEDDSVEDEKLDIESGYLLDPSTKTKKLKCPFAMTASYKKATNVWTLRTTCNEHNHPQLDPLLNHPMLRKRLDQLNLLILDLYKVGTKPLLIESKIKDQFPDVLIKREDIYNEIRGYKRKIKKQTQRFNISRQGRHKKIPLDHHQSRNDDDAVAAAFLANGDDHDLQYEMSRTNQEEFQRQFDAAAAEAAAAAVGENNHQHHHHLHHQNLDDQYQQYQLQDGLLDGTAAAAIAAVANAARHHDKRHDDDDDRHHGELTMDNIDSRLVGE